MKKEKIKEIKERLKKKETPQGGGFILHYSPHYLTPLL